MKRYDPQAVRRLTEQIAEAAGVPAGDAAVFADSLVSADLSGAGGHGVSRLDVYIRRIQKGLINPAAGLGVDRPRGAVLAVDAANGLGQVQASKTLDLLTERARENGVAAAAIRRSQHFGALAYYCNKAAGREMILLAASNAEPAMAPEGASEPFFGTNPLAASFPTGKGFPVKVDLATSVVARGRIIAARREGKPIPPDWAVDPDGNPTTDPEQALAGAVLTMAGARGYALAVLVEVLSGVLSGAAVGKQVGAMYRGPDQEQNVGHFFCLLDIAAFMEVEEFKRRIGRMIDEIKSCRKRPGAEEILVPGERTHRTALRNRREGIPLQDRTVQELETLAREAGIGFGLTPVEGRVA